MYKLLVADDEQKDRNIVRLLVEKQYGDLFEILEAKSGTQALEILRNDQIDLLLLDMNMPGLSGMGVIRELKKPTYLIILTAYSFFDYAREALRYGVKDYILKPPIRSELYAAIDRFLQERKEQPGDNGLRQKALARELATQMLFYSNAQKIGNYCQLLGLEGSRISLAVLLGSGGSVHASEHMLSSAEQFLDGQGVRYAALSFRDGIAVLFFWRTAEEQGRIQKLLPGLQSCAVGRMGFQENIPSYGEIPQAFIRLCDQHSLSRRAVSVSDQTDAVEQALRNQDFDGAIEHIQKDFDWQDYQAHGDALKFQLAMMLFTCTKHLFANADKRGAYSKLSVLLGAENLEQLFCGTAEYLHWIIHEIKQSVYTNSYMDHRVISAVSTDCARPWTIEGLAAELKISPYYLSHLFKEYTGSNFTDYLAERRIERAIELMRQPELTLAQIGEMVGYLDQNYFSRVFRKRCGTSARQYRKQLLSE